MAISSGQITVGLTRVAIDGVSTNPFHLHIHNNENTKSLYIGGPDLTISNGLKIPAGDSLEVIIAPNDQLYVVSDSGTHLISWLRMDV
jgi:hypothetical protein